MKNLKKLQGQRVTLVGGAGFIGHHLALHLKQCGADVSIVDSLQINNLFSLIASQENSEFSPLYTKMTQERLRLLQEADIPLHVIDARDYHALSNVLGQLKPQIIIQLAAVAHAGKSNKDPYSTFDHSLRTLENALDYAKSSVEHFIYFSSSMVYGHFCNGFVTEESPCEPLGIYGALKYAGEKMVIAYNQVFDLPFTIIRPSALYGERCISRRVGQILIENAIRGEELCISGDGSERLDFTYIKDLVHGVQRVIEHPNSHGEIFNLTFGASRAVRDILELLQHEFGELKVRFTDKDKLMPNRGTLSIEKASSLIGFVPSYPLELGFKNYVDWYKSNNRKSSLTELIELEQTGNVPPTLDGSLDNVPTEYKSNTADEWGRKSSGL